MYCIIVTDWREQLYNIRLVLSNVFINITKLIEKGLVKKEYNGLKVLASGELKVEKLIVKANKFSKKASEVITSKGGSAEVI